MADRSRLHISKLEDFKEWLVKDGWEIEEPKGVWEVLRARRAGRKNPLIIYTKADVKEHLSVMDRDSGVIGAYLKDCKKTKTNADSKTTEWMAQKWLEQFEFPTDENSDDALAVICEALQEYPKFRAIGTVEEISAKLEELEWWHKSEVNSKIKNVFANTSTRICHNCDHKDEYIEELEAEVEELQALKEKSVAKKPIEQGTDDKTIYKCSCGNVLMEKYSDGLICGFITDYCEVCGQKLLRADVDWE